MISYSVNREDALLARVFREVTAGFYVDVGANRPVEGSVTHHFYERGWHGINIEPGAMFPELAAARPRDINLPCAISNVRGQVTFYEFPVEHGYSTCDADQAKVLEARGWICASRTIPSRTLADVCEEFVGGTTIDFLSIDVEGAERAVLEGADWSRWRPRVMLVEATRPDSPEPTHQLWEDLLLQADYRFALFDGLNRFYVRREDESLLCKLAVPVNVFDDAIPFSHVQRVAELERRIARLESWRRPWRRLRDWIRQATKRRDGNATRPESRGNACLPDGP